MQVSSLSLISWTIGVSPSLFRCFNLSLINSDAVFILAFSIIMLATDRHSPMIKPQNKITLEAWKRTLRDMNNGGNYREAFLDAIFERICAMPFQLLPDSNTIKTATTFLDEKERQSAFIDESEHMTAIAQEMIKNALSNKKEFFKATNIDYVKPMFEGFFFFCLFMFIFSNLTCLGTWMSLLAAFGMSLEDSQVILLTSIVRIFSHFHRIQISINFVCLPFKTRSE